jgi:hypothetical protein
MLCRSEDRRPSSSTHSLSQTLVESIRDSLSATLVSVSQGRLCSTTFQFLLPIPGSLLSASQESVIWRPRSLKAPWILIVDDSAVSRKLVRRNILRLIPEAEVQPLPPSPSSLSSFLRADRGVLLLQGSHDEPRQIQLREGPCSLSDWSSSSSFCLWSGSSTTCWWTTSLTPRRGPSGRGSSSRQKCASSPNTSPLLVRWPSLPSSLTSPFLLQASPETTTASPCLTSC